MTNKRRIDRIKKQCGVGLTWDSAANCARAVTEEEARKRAHNVSNQWGAHIGDTGFFTADGSAPAGATKLHQKFHPGRDIVWGGRTHSVLIQCERLVSQGVPLESHKSGALFLGDSGLRDLEMLAEMAEGKGPYKHLGGKRFLDAAPDLFVAQELVKATGEVVREEFVELTARRVLPFRDFNTFLQTFAWDRIAHRGPAMSQPVNAQDMSGYSFRRTDPVRQQVFGSLYHHRDSASWTELELQIYAEARSNGAPDLNMMTERMAEARKRLMYTENLLAYFGWSELGVPGAPIEGLLTHSDIDKTSAAAFNSGTGADDVAVILDPIKSNYTATKGIEAYDTLLVGPEIWAYISTTDYKSLDSESNETVAEVILRKGAAFGLKDIVMVPEMEHDAALQSNLEDEHGISASQAAIWAGGFEGADAMVLFNSSQDKGYVARGKDIWAMPQEVSHGTHEAQFFMSSGGLTVKRPEAFEVLKDATIS